MNEFDAVFESNVNEDRNRKYALYTESDGNRRQELFRGTKAELVNSADEMFSNTLSDDDLIKLIKGEKIGPVSRGEAKNLFMWIEVPEGRDPRRDRFLSK